MNDSRPQTPVKDHAWAWVPSLYFAEGLPYVVVMTVSVILYKRLGLSNAQIAFYTSWLYLPWTLKFVWSPFIDLFKSKRWWIVTMQLLIGALLGGVAFTLPGPHWLQWSMAFFWIMAFSSATHDIAADGFYMHGLCQERQQFFIGIRNTFYRVAMICGQGLLVMLAGKFENAASNPLGMEQIPFAWALTFLIMAVLFIALGLWHLFALPRPESDRQRDSLSGKEIITNFGKTFRLFFQKSHIGIALAFMLLYRFSEAQLVKLTSPFLLDSVDVGGLGLETGTVGFAYGTVGVLALVLGGILGGIVISRRGLKKSLMPMALALCLPNLVYVYLAWAQPQQLATIYAGIALEQLGYGYGFTAYTAYLLHFCQGEFKTAHYAICTAVMALGMMIPGMFAGRLQEWFQQLFAQSLGGYTVFFLWIMLCTLPCFYVVHLAKSILPDRTDR
ncbi:MAG: MFS transporter [Bacteroidales bacterium]|jgi:PAT family beta-lactamase induction signal transducer AmpG|nr:MFS transporter [Bacteroidales bacterium]